MGKAKISETKIANIKKLKKLGHTVKEIAELTGVSTITVNDYTLPGFYEGRKKRTRDYLRQTTLGTGSTRQDMVVHKHLSKRPRPEGCELCGGINTMLYYHHWNEENLSLGIWACFRCHRLAELMDAKGSRGVFELMVKYSKLKKELEEVSDSSRKASSRAGQLF